MRLSEQIDQHLLDLAWSLWTELGVAGIKRQHQRCLIAPEELIILTVVLADLDPRLRDEALDWCSRHHEFISISRLKTLLKPFGESAHKAFSAFAGTLNSVSGANWPLIVPAKALQFKPSGKSTPPACERPALLGLRIRALFGTGARADLITFFLTEKQHTFKASETTDIGYSKRSLADLLEAFVQSGFFSVFTTKNQHNYCFTRRDQMISMLGLMPEVFPSWRQILEMLLPLRSLIQQVEKKSATIQMIEIRNTLAKMDNELRKLKLSPPPIQHEALLYLDSFNNWILKIVESWAQGNFENSHENMPVFSWEEKRAAAKHILIQLNGLFSNIESLNTHSNEETASYLFENYKNSFSKQIDLHLPKIDSGDQKVIRKQINELLAKDRQALGQSSEAIIHLKTILEKYF